MGQAYVEKMLEWYLMDSKAFIFYLEEDGICVGYCGGLKFQGNARAGSATDMIQHSYGAAVRSFLKRPWLFFHPEFISKYPLVIKNVLRRFRSKKPLNRPAKEVLPAPHTGLIVIGVDPNYRGKGYASQLLREFEVHSKSLGFDRMMLTVRSDNTQAISVYERNGWKQINRDGQTIEMEKRINDL
jgi:ribosomal protein S18 acetylase RimI-like enzyme